MVGEARNGRTDTCNRQNYDTTPVGGSVDEFGRRLAKIAVTQICESAGFRSARSSALDALADLAVRFVRDLGHSAGSRSALSGRTSLNELDIIQGLEDLGISATAAATESDVHHCLVGSGVVRGITRFVESAKEVPFPRPVPRFPVVGGSVKKAPSFAQVGEESPRKHIPTWLPAFPDPHTYIYTPVWNERSTDGRMEQIEQARQRRKAERSLLSLQKSIARNGSFGFVPEAERRTSVIDTFRPVIEVAKGGGFECGDDQRRVLSKRRPVVRFKFGIEKRLLTMPLSLGGLGVKNEGWLLRDEEKDDKKRRAEMILKEAMQNPEELLHL